MTIIQVIISAPAEIAYAVSSATALAAVTIGYVSAEDDANTSSESEVEAENQSDIESEV